MSKANLKVMPCIFPSWDLGAIGQGCCLAASSIALQQRPEELLKGPYQKVLQRRHMPSLILEGFGHTAIHSVSVV